MATANGNLFRQAQKLLKNKPIDEMTQGEVLTVKAATIPLTILPEFNDVTTDEGLEELAKMVEEDLETTVIARRASKGKVTNNKRRAKLIDIKSAEGAAGKK